MKLSYLFLLTLSTLLLGYFSQGIFLSPTGGAVSSFHDYVTFTAQAERGRPSGQGSVVLTLPFPARSCTFTGSWITDNDQFNQRGSCHGAKGIFTGYVDATQQYVINNPDLFRWAGLSQAALNPSEQKYEGYSFWMETCDPEYYRPNHATRYGITGTITGFGTKQLSFTWNYFDDSNIPPHVDFMVTLDCTLFS